MNRWHALALAVPTLLVTYLTLPAHSTGDSVRLAQAGRPRPRPTATPTATPTPVVDESRILRTDLEMEILLSQQKVVNTTGPTIVRQPTPTPEPVRTYSGKVVEVLDGDTLKVQFGRRHLNVRLFGIDCPELEQAFGKEAKQFTSDVALNQQVQMVSLRTDKAKRHVATVTIEGSSLNDALVSNGMAWRSNPPEASGAEVMRLERSARTAKRGLWADAAPIAPWAWRKARLESMQATAAPSPAPTPDTVRRERNRRHERDRAREAGTG